MGRKTAAICIVLCGILFSCAGGAGSAFAKKPSEKQDARATIKSSAEVKLPRATPESKGISSLYILDMLNEFEKRNIEVHSVLVAVDGNVIFEGFYNPYNPNTPYIVHSLTKLFTNTAAGIAYTSGKLKLTDKVVDYFPERVIGVLLYTFAVDSSL